MKIGTLIATALLTLTMAVGVVAPAGAAVTVTKDRRGDTTTGKRFGDLRKITVNHGIGNVKTTILANGADYVLMYVDTDERDPGPEYVVTVGSEVVEPQVYRVDDFSGAKVVGTDPGYLDDRTCDLKGRIVKRKGAYFGFAFDIPRSCLGNPRRVRVSVQGAQDFPGTTNDWAPGVRRFGPWTASGPVGG